MIHLLALEGHGHEHEHAHTRTLLIVLSIYLLPQLLERCLLIVVFVQDLGSGQIEILLCNVHSPFSERVHACFGADALQFGAGTSIHSLCDLRQVDSAGQVH